MLHKELDGYPNYGVADDAADILYPGQTGAWTFSIPSGAIQSASVVVSMVADDGNVVPTSDYTFSLWSSSCVFYSAGQLPHGVPFDSQFTNWVQLSYAATLSPGGSYTLTIANTSPLLSSSEESGGIIESANKSSGSTENNYCLDVHDAATASGTKIDLAPCNGTIAQSFWLSGFTLALGSGHTDANTGNPECLDVLDNDEASAATLDDSDCNGTNAQWFVLDTAHQITLANDPSLCVAITTSPVNGTSHVALAPCSETSSQEWYLSNKTKNECAPSSLLCYEAGGSNFVNYQTGTCLDIDGNNSASGTTIDAYSCTTGNQAQLWSLDVSFDAPQPAPPND